MPSVAQEPLINGVSFMLKDKHPEPAISGFTAVNVNGRASPPSPPSRTNGVNGMNGDTIHVRPFEPRPSEDLREPKASLPVREDRNPAPPRPESAQNGLSNGHRSPPAPAYRTGTPESQGKRKRSSSAEEDHSYRPAQDASRRRLDSLNSTDRDEPSSRPPPVTMEAPLHPHFRPVERAETEVRWPVRDQTERIHRAYSEHPPRTVEIPEPRIKTSPTSSVAPVGAIEPQSATELSSTTEITRAGVQVDKKQRKRQFANRTKTGCATCRRRKKKCDEAKPECNNCQRGGFICEGYANKVPYPKNNVKQSHIPLQAKDRYQDPPQYFHTHGQIREGYPDPNAQHSMEGARARPIVIEEHERQPDRNAWGNSWSHPPRPQYPPEQPTGPQYPHPPNNMTSHERPPSNGHHIPHPHEPASQHQPPPDRMYPHTPQSMTSQSLQNSPAVTAQLALQHSAHHHHHQQQQQQQQQTMHPPPLPGPPGQRPPAPVPQPPKPQKTEKQKMLSGEHYLFFHSELREERNQCKAALYRFHNSDNPTLGISREERDRLFRGVVEAQWVRQKGPDQPVGSVGQDVEVDVGFNCEYGYNIHVGDAVVIGANVTIQDCSRVNIGKLSIIGPNVNIYTNTVASDPRFRNGSRGTAVAKEIIIEENVFIGGNATILPGVKIGKGSTIAAGAVVTQDIGPFTIAYGKKTHAQAVRGIWNDSYAR